MCLSMDGATLSMRIPQTAISSFNNHTVPWSADWAWGLPLIVLTVVLHVLCLGIIHQWAVRICHCVVRRPYASAAFVMVTGATTLLATCLHGLEAIIWAVAYRLLDALPDSNSAMLYSLSAITSYGHANLVLEPHWQLMGALEALNGWLLFGLTTAFLFGIIEKLWIVSGSWGGTDSHRAL
jgi:hypothetical protein